MRRLILVQLLIILALAAIGGAIYYWIYNNYNYYSTDDAQISGPIVNVSAPVAGTLSALDVKLGDKVTAGQTIGSITPATSTTAKGPASLDLTSPMNGTILQVAAVQGQNVAPGLTLAVLTDPSTVSVTAYVDENAINNVSIGQPVDIHIDAYSNTSFSGHVHSCSNYARWHRRQGYSSRHECGSDHPSPLTAWEVMLVRRMSLSYYKRRLS